MFISLLIFGDEKSPCPLIIRDKGRNNASAIPPLFAAPHSATLLAVHQYAPGAVTRAPRLAYLAQAPFGSPSQAHSTGCTRRASTIPRLSVSVHIRATFLAHRFVVMYFNKNIFVCQAFVSIKTKTPRAALCIVRLTCYNKDNFCIREDFP